MDDVVIGENNKTEKSWIFFKKAVDKFPLHCYNNGAVRNDGKTCGGVAHLGERLHGMQEVRGSIPLISTKNGSVELLFFRNEFALIYRLGNA